MKKQNFVNCFKIPSWKRTHHAQSWPDCPKQRHNTFQSSKGGNNQNSNLKTSILNRQDTFWYSKARNFHFMYFCKIKPLHMIYHVNQIYSNIVISTKGSMKFSNFLLFFCWNERLWGEVFVWLKFQSFSVLLWRTCLWTGVEFTFHLESDP